MKKRLHGLLFALLIITFASERALATKPKLVVNFVVSALRASDLERFKDNFTEGGFKRLMEGGTYYTEAYYDYMRTSTAAGMATIATGAQPSVHGVVGDKWWNYVDGSMVELIIDRQAYPVEFSTGSGNYSPHRLTAPTVGDMLLSSDNQSKQYSIGVDARSAIVLNGKAGVAFWAEKNQTHWTTSSKYLTRIPSWVADYNRHDTNTFYTLTRWTPLYEATRYKNSEVAVIEDITDKNTKLLSDINLKLASNDYGRMCYTPAGNTMLIEFAESLIALEHLGKDSSTDILNIAFDATRYIAETYGPESMEYEDMLYRLDKDLENFLIFLYAQFKSEEELVVTLSSAHGTSPSFNPVGGTERERFNNRQMEVIVNAFLGARYGSDDYILGFSNNALYLNHELILRKRLDLEDICDEVAVFMLQLRGVRTALTASALRNTSFSEGRSRLMQQSFHATRSGDIIIDLMPGWIIEEDDYRSSSDGGYNYDSRVPLIIYGGKAKAERVERRVKMTELAPTMAHILGIDTPWASEEMPLNEFK